MKKKEVEYSNKYMWIILSLLLYLCLPRRYKGKKMGELLISSKMNQVI